MKHIALVLPGIERIAGAERQALLLAAGLARRGWKVTLIALTGTSGSASAELAASRIGFVSLGMRKGLADPRGWFPLLRWLRSNHPDVVHAHLPHAATIARLSRLFAPPCVVLDTLHTTNTRTLLRKLTYRLTRRLPDHVTAVSQGVADAHLHACMAAPRNLTVLPNGIHPDQWTPDPTLRARCRAELALNAEFLWVAAGRLEPVKNYPTLLRAFAQLPANNRLLIAGAGPDEPTLRALATDLGVANRVRFAGFLADMRPTLNAADAFVLTSHWEGLPMALLEAGASALPAVAPDIPGVREILTHGCNGTLYRPADPQSLCEAMTRMQALGRDQRQAMGHAARQNILHRFSLESVLDRWEALYADLLCAASPSATRPAPPERAPLTPEAKPQTPSPLAQSK